MDWAKLKLTGSHEPLYRQLSGIIRQAIAGGTLKVGDRIPSVADLAKQVGVNRATVVGAFQDLERDGLIESHVGRGTFVAAPAPMQAPAYVAAPVGRRGAVPPGVRELLSVDKPPDTINLSSGVPDPATVSELAFGRLVKRAMATDPHRLIEYGGPAGLPEIREAFAGRAGLEPGQIVITNGSQQAVSLLSCWALEAGRDILCETPTYTGIPGAFLMMGNGVTSVPWLGDALDLARAPRSRSLLYICPDHHNPTGQSLSLAARREVAAFAAANDCVVVVDEIFRDLRFRGDPLPSLYSLLPPGKRVGVGSISKSFLTGLRIGYMAADPGLVAEMLPYKRYLDLGSPALTQAVAAAALADGYDVHVERMRGVYRERVDACAEAIAREFPSDATITAPEGGFHLWVTMPPGLSAVQLYLRGLEKRVAVSPGPAHDIDGRYGNCFRLSMTHEEPAALREAVARLGAILKERASLSGASGPGVSL